jgi:hypothetical protein
LRLGRCAAVPVRCGFSFVQRKEGEIERLVGSRLQSRAQTAAGILPGNEFNGPAIDLLQTLKDLLPPRLLNGSINLLIQTADEGVN